MGPAAESEVGNAALIVMSPGCYAISIVGRFGAIVTPA
jgi:hypothetical protein